ncbi:hypothetical protein M9H77_25837 [Catharanthus roseus]|uniref:Uncharacterized protein n=1 Tax=Catharanthus roseus TaxID=4058 RepID=A0ACC0AA32_CATRO|nr:hypothetical protein M9H77_25837 [Catharanthus roseus]
MGNSKGKQEMYISSQGIEKEESMKPSLLEKSSIVNELLQARIEINKSVEMHVEGEMSKEYFGDSMSDTRALKKRRALSEKFEKDESSKEEENDLEENERTKEMSEEKRENSKEESNSMTNCLSSHLSLEDPLMRSSIMFYPSCYGFVNLDDTSLVELNIVGFALVFDRNSLQHACTITSMSGRRHTMEFEGQGKNVGGKLFLCYGDSSMILDSFSSWTPMWGMIPSYFLDLFVGNFLVKKSIRRNVERCSCMIPFFEIFVIALNGIAPFENHFLNVKVQLEDPCDDHKILIGLKFLNAFLIENILGFQFYNLHFKESMFLLSSENKKKDGFGVLKTVIAFTCQVLLEIVHSIHPLVHIISNVARILWLFKGIDSRTNPFEGGAASMIRNRYENMESFQGLVIRSRARKIDLEMQRNKLRRGTIDLPLLVGFSPKTILRIRPTIDGRSRPTVAGRSREAKESWTSVSAIPPSRCTHDYMAWFICRTHPRIQPNRLPYGILYRIPSRPSASVVLDMIVPYINLDTSDPDGMYRQICCIME